MHPYLAAAVQMTSTPDLDHNLAQAEEWIEYAVRQGSELIVLPENFAFLGPKEDKLRLAHQIQQRAEEFLQKMAQRFQVTVVGGGYPVPVRPEDETISRNGSSPDVEDRDQPVQSVQSIQSVYKVFNTLVVVGPEGDELARYQKIHLFDVNVPDGNTYRESDSVAPGHQPQIYRSDRLGTLGLSVCYDVRFPELYRGLVDQGAEVLLVPAAFTAFTGRDHWQVLLQARAIENTCYVIAPAQVGIHYERRQCHGHALILDPWGAILADAGDQPGVALAEISPDRLHQIRRQMPSIHNRRLSCA